MKCAVKRSGLFWLLVALAVGGCEGIDKSADSIGDHNAVIGGVGRIAYLRRSPATGAFHIYVVGPNGRNDRSLNSLSDRADYTGPSWSPDGTRIAFASNLGGNANFDIYVMNADGTRLQPVLKTVGGNFAPAWSPDGTKIAFQAQRSNATGWDIFAVNLDGSDERPLIALPGNDELPAWSPDGTKIAFQSSRGLGTDIFVADADGGNIRRLTDGNGRVHASPAWSPDSRQIAFESNRHQVIAPDSGIPKAEPEIYVIDVDGAHLRRITHVGPTALASKPTWSPDGRQIAFELYVEDFIFISSLYIVNADGSNLYAIPNIPRKSIYPRWSPVP